jgi:RNA polymerase sigma factor (sigma-70 family)
VISRDELVHTFDTHGPVLLAAARMVTGDDDEAQDLVQATFEIALRHIGSLREPSALRAWLLRIEMREAFRTVRRLRRLVRLDGHVRDLSIASDPIGQRAEVGEALMTLPPRIRAAIAVHYLAGLSVRETAVALGVSENTIKSQLKTGLARLREVLGDD